MPLQPPIVIQSHPRSRINVSPYSMHEALVRSGSVQVNRRPCNSFNAVPTKVYLTYDNASSHTKYFDKHDGAKNNPPNKRVISSAKDSTVTLISVVIQIAETRKANDVAVIEHNNIKSAKRKNLPAEP